MADNNTAAKHIYDKVFGAPTTYNVDLLAFIHDTVIPLILSGMDKSTLPDMTADEYTLAQYINYANGGTAGKSTTTGLVLTGIAIHYAKEKAAAMFSMPELLPVVDKELQRLRTWAGDVMGKLWKSKCKHKKFRKRHLIREECRNALGCKDAVSCLAHLKLALGHAIDSNSHSHVLPDVIKMLTDACNGK